MIDDQAKKKIFDADLANIVRQTKAGKPLTKAQRAVITETAERAPESQGPGRPRSAAPELPIYDSIAQCAHATKIPATLIKKAKRSGCAAFRSNRVDLSALLEWIFSQAEGGENWIDFRAKYAALREKIEHDKRAELVVEKEATAQGIHAAEGVFFGALDRIFLSTLPPFLANLDEFKVRDAIRPRIEEMKNLLRAELAQLAAVKPCPRPKPRNAE